ncbi:MAG: HXXEE domain-containing protein [Candidatus Angelobacter sp.]
MSEVELARHHHLTAKEMQVGARLGGVVALVEFASLSLLLLLFGQKIVPDKVGVLLVLLLPITFGLHVTEEFIFPGGFISWDNIFRPKYTDTPGSFYVKVNAIPSVASVLIAVVAFDYAGKYSLFGIRGWLAFLTFLMWNAFSHVRGAVRTRRYSPGMVTGVFLLVPLTIVSYIHFRNSGVIDSLSMVLCVVVALAIQPILDFVKTRGLKNHA